MIDLKSFIGDSCEILKSMTRSAFSALCALLLSSALGACSNTPSEAELRYQSQYWQRAEASSALYTRGPKAQQMLNQDIARCTSDLKELEALGAVREAVPANNWPDGRVPIPTTPDGDMAVWNTPERDGYLYTEHLDYHDFEGCMTAKGWERVEDLPYDVAEKARSNYLRTIRGREYHSKIGYRDSAPPRPPSQYDKVNQ